LAGYAVECGLKAFLIRRLEARHISARNLLDVAWALGFHKDERRFCTHDLEFLRDECGLHALMEGDPPAREDFMICLKWKPGWRYRSGRVETGVEPREFVDAMARVYRWVERQAP
jgi:hypothetical protein